MTSDFEWGCEALMPFGYSTDRCCVRCHTGNPVDGKLPTLILKGKTYQICCNARDWYRGHAVAINLVEGLPLPPIGGWRTDVISIPPGPFDDAFKNLFNYQAGPNSVEGAKMKTMADVQNETLYPDKSWAWLQTLPDPEGRRAKEIAFARYLRENTIHLSAEKLRKAIVAFADALDKPDAIPNEDTSDLYKIVGIDAAVTYRAVLYYVNVLGAYGTEGHLLLTTINALAELLYARREKPQPVVPAIPRLDTTLPDPPLVSEALGAKFLSLLVAGLTRASQGRLYIADVDMTGNADLKFTRNNQNTGYVVELVPRA